MLVRAELNQRLAVLADVLVGVHRDDVGTRIEAMADLLAAASPYELRERQHRLRNLDAGSPVYVDVDHEFAGREFDAMHEANAVTLVVVGDRIASGGCAFEPIPFAGALPVA